MGYRYAWPDADIVGVDIRPQPRYPFRFVQADAETFPIDGFDFIHASPPCRDHTRYTMQHGYDGTGAMLGRTIERLETTGVPWVVESVGHAADHGRPSFVLCGSAFGLGVRRHRRFWTNVDGLVAPCCDHKAQGPVVTVTGHSGGKSTRDGIAGRACLAGWRDAMGIHWTTRDELAQAIPPAYTAWIGQRMPFGP